METGLRTLPPLPMLVVPVKTETGLRAIPTLPMLLVLVPLGDGRREDLLILGH